MKQIKVPRMILRLKRCADLTSPAPRELPTRALAMLLIRLPLGYVFAFGWGALPAMGVAGIWWASVIGMAITCTAYGLILYRCDFNKCAKEALDRREKEEILKSARSPLLDEEEAAGAGAAV
mmetsp:Transcript_14824/g.12327  ORF Transcript_14824/g.12327 Transcript_14824/m.12327 type:complete len:122 (-) Transcript_14824:113-478(-)